LSPIGRRCACLAGKSGYPVRSAVAVKMAWGEGEADYGRFSESAPRVRL
jgi:hypothetical protein